jgi:hypothetical protein
MATEFKVENSATIRKRSVWDCSPGFVVVIVVQPFVVPHLELVRNTLLL